MNNSERVLKDLQEQNNRKLTFIGPFTDDEVKELCEACRKIEERRPDQVFMMTIEAKALDQQNSEEVKDFIKKIYPLSKGIPVDLETFIRPEVN